MKKQITTNYRELIMDSIKNIGCCNKLNVEDGVPYIYTSSGLFVLPQFWGLYEEMEKPVGIALKEGGHGVLVALKGSEEYLVLLNEYQKNVTGKSFSNDEEAKNDWNGKENTELFVKYGSPAAKFCADYETETVQKGNWWLPSYAEMELICRHKDKIDACLTICGGSPLFYGWHWTSTQFEFRSAWIFIWVYGYTDSNFKGDKNWVRPVSCFPE